MKTNIGGYLGALVWVLGNRTHTHTHRHMYDTRAYAAVYCCYNMYKVTSIRITLQETHNKHTTTNWRLHFALGFIIHRLGLRQMPIKYELITTILCRSIRFTQYYGSLSFSLSGLLSHSHWQTRTQNLYFFFISTSRILWLLFTFICGQLDTLHTLLRCVCGGGECAHLFWNLYAVFNGKSTNRRP